MADDFTAKDAAAATQTFKAKEISSKKYPGKILYDEAGAEVLGLVTASPGATTVLGRLKAAVDALTGTLTVGSHAVTNAGTFAVQLAANQSVNVAQVNGVTTTMGNGASGTGVQRVTIANDSTGVIALTAPATTTTVMGAFVAPAANPTQVITRPSDTTAYAVNDLVANSTTAGSVAYSTIAVARVSGAPVLIRRLRLFSNHTTGLSGIVFDVRLWTAAPTYTNGDNGAYAVATGAANYIGRLQGTWEQAADGAFCELTPMAGMDIVHVPSGTTVVWDMKTLTAFTPQSGKTFTCMAEVMQG